MASLSSSPAPLVVVVTGAAGQIGYSLLPLLANGSTFGASRGVELRLLEIPQAVGALEGVKMELQDCAFSCLEREIVCTADPAAAFAGADVAILVGGFPRRPGMLRKDLIQINTKIFSGMGKALDAAKPTCKVLVVANPANTNALTCVKNCSTVPAKNFAAMTRLDYNRATAQVALRLGTRVHNVRNVIIWGNHSATQFPDPTTDGVVVGADGARTALREALSADSAWLRGDFLSTVQQRGKAIIDARGKSSALSAAQAAADCMRTWVTTGTAVGETVAMAVYNDRGYYGVAEDIVFSFPCECRGGEWVVKEGLALTEYAQGKLKVSEAELLEERSAAMEILETAAEE
jgi:malate dehydrogenase